MINQEHAQAFEAWEKDWRENPDAFLTAEEVAAMELATLSEQQAITFAAYLRQHGHSAHDTLQTTVDWFKQAVPTPSDQARCVQIGCHFEEVAEMCDALGLYALSEHLVVAAEDFKQKDSMAVEAVRSADRKALLDAMRDQCVTGVGVDYMFGADTVGAAREVNRSNWSKFVDGKPVFNEQGKIAKGPDYSAPELDAFVGKPC